MHTNSTTHTDKVSVPGQTIRQITTESTQTLGGQAIGDFLALSARLWDPTIGIIVYVGDKPTFVSSCVMDVFQAQDRCDVHHVPPLAGTDWDYYAINEGTLPKVAVHGETTVVFLGERKEPYPNRPMSAYEVEALRRPGDELFLACSEAMTPSNFQTCMIRHDGYVAKQASKLPDLLGFATDDTQWIPRDWFDSIPPGPCRRATSKVMTANGESATLEWLRISIPNFNVFWVRLRPTTL